MNAFLGGACFPQILDTQQVLSRPIPYPPLMVSLIYIVSWAPCSPVRLEEPRGWKGFRCQ